MSLIDADKQNDDRANPRLNTDDNVSNRLAHKTIGTSYKTAGNQDSSRIIFDKNAIKGLHDADTTDIFIGYDPALSPRPVVRIAKEGFDATTSSAENLIFNSDQNVFKVVAIFTGTVPALSLNTGGANYAVGTAQRIVFNHGLSTIPAVLAFWTDALTYVSLPWTRATQFGAGGFSYTEFHAYSDATSVAVEGVMSGFNINTTQPASNVKIYVLQETAN